MSLLTKNTVAVFIVSLFCSIAYSQESIDERTMQKVNLEALKLVEQYQFLYDMRKGRDYDNFIDLFEDENSEMNNDIMPDNNVNQSVKINDYIGLFLENYTKPMQVTIDPYEVSSIRNYKNGTGEVTVFAKKTMGGPTKRGVFYSDSFDVEIVIKFDLPNKRYQIKKVILIEPKGKYFVVDAKLKTAMKDARSMSQKDTLLVNGTRVTLDANGRYVLKNLTKSNTFKIQGLDENIIGSAEVSLDNLNTFERSRGGDKNTRILELKYPLFYSEFSVSVNPFNLSPVIYTGNNEYYSLSNNISYDVGVDIGMHLNKDYNSKFNYYLKTGVHFKNLDFTINLDEYSYSTPAIDPDDFAYERIHSITDISESVNSTYLVAPIALNTTYTLKEFILNIEVGAQFHYSIGANYTSKASALYSGYYEDLFNITFAENGVYDFGNYNIEGNGELVPVQTMFSTYYSLGIGKKISKRTTIGLSFLNNYGLSNMFELDSKAFSGHSEELNSVTNISNDFKLREIYLNLNLKYKF